MRFLTASVIALGALVPQFLAQGPPEAISAGVHPTNGSPPEWSSVFHSLKSEGKIDPTITSPARPSGVYGPGRGPWAPNAPSASLSKLLDAKSWGGPNGYAPWGPSNWGPWSARSTDTAWRTNAPWTKWWGGSACPGTDWPGWTEGPWSTEAPWTGWEACAARTTAGGTYTTSISGSEVVSTKYEVEVASAVGAGSGGAAVPMRTAGPAVAVGAVIVVVVVGVVVAL